MAPNGSSDKDDNEKAPNLIDSTKEYIIETILGHSDGTTHHHYKETHGQRTSDINENTALEDVKAPNVFERVKEEVEALVHTIHIKNKHQHLNMNAEAEADSLAGDLNAINNEKASQQVKSTESSPHHHHKETHGRSNDIDENTPIDAVKGPNVFERAKEEIEALVQTIHCKKEPASKSEGGFGIFIGKVLAKVCHPWDTKKN